MANALEGGPVELACIAGRNIWEHALMQSSIEGLRSPHPIFRGKEA